MTSLSVPRPMGVRDILRLPAIRRSRTPSSPTTTERRPDLPRDGVSAALILAPGMVAR
jgi:hypothetical protein